MFHKHDRPNRHQQQPVEADKIQQFRKHERETGDDGGRSARQQRDQPAGPARRHSLKRQPRPVDRRIRGRPSRNDDREDARSAQGLPGNFTRIKIGHTDLHQARRGRAHHPGENPRQVVPEKHAEG